MFPILFHGIPVVFELIYRSPVVSERASKTGEYQGAPRGQPEGTAGSGCLAAPDLGFGPERILGKTDLFGRDCGHSLKRA